MAVHVFELIAEQSQTGRCIKFPLPNGSAVEIGRKPSCNIVVDWDPYLSQTHVTLTAGNDAVELQRLQTARNPVFFQGNEIQSCRLRSGDRFVIGTTTFRLVATSPDGSPYHPLVEHLTFARQELRQVRFRDADRRIDVLTHLPEVIWGARSQSELLTQVVQLLLAGIPHAEAVAVVQLDSQNGVQILHWDRRQQTSGRFQPSGRLVHEAHSRKDCSVLHVWESSDPSKQNYTAMAEFDWAFCTPVLPTPTESWGLYVAGRLDPSHPRESLVATDGVHLQADVKFAELVAEILSSILRLNRQERQLTVLRQFLAPPIVSMLGDELQVEQLEPRECDVTVLFCDLRGFSQRSEESVDDLRGLLDRVSQALGVMTNNILAHGGVTGDFQGDAALGFWGWPFASVESPLQACRAALGIQARFTDMQQDRDHPLCEFRMGIGIAQGRAVAGKIGTSDQVKFTVFGPVVNLASRLEGLTKQLHVPILLDEWTTRVVRDSQPKFPGRVRKLAQILPYGMDTPLVVSELLPPYQPGANLTDDNLHCYERGVDAFIAGRWDDAYHFLHQMPPGDRAQDFLTQMITRHNRVAPPGWDGIVRLTNK